MIVGTDKAVRHLSECSKTLSSISITLKQYPLSCPPASLLGWKSKIEEILLKTKGAIDKIGKDQNVKLKKALDSFGNVLQTSASLFSSQANLCEYLQLAKVSNRLNEFTALHHANKAEKERLLVRFTLTLDEKYFCSSSCENTLSKWLGPGLMMPLHVAVVTERLKPGYDVLIRDVPLRDDQTVQRPTLTFYPDDDSWILCEQKPGESNRQIKEVEKHIEQEFQFQSDLTLSEEQKAKLLSKLHYDEEYKIHHVVKFHHQIVYDHINQFSLGSS